MHEPLALKSAHEGARRQAGRHVRAHAHRTNATTQANTGTCMDANPHTSTQELIYRHREWGGGVVRRESARNQKKMAKEAGWQVKCIPPTTNNNNNNKLA